MGVTRAPLVGMPVPALEKQRGVGNPCPTPAMVKYIASAFAVLACLHVIFCPLFKRRGLRSVLQVAQEKEPGAPNLFFLRHTSALSGHPSHVRFPRGSCIYWSRVNH